MQPHRREPFASLDHESLRLVLFGGKGGVGKTTVAAAFSLYLSDRYPRKRVLVVSTDPAHSLSDSFNESLGSIPEPVYGRGNLFGLELDAEQLFVRFREKHRLALQKILERGTYLDDDDLSRFLDLSFPGLDEVMALLHVIDLVERAAYDLVIVDTAPTGHTLRLFDLPDVMQTWTAFLDTLMAKHRYMVRIYTRTYKSDDADMFINTLVRDLTKIQQVFQDEKQCHFVPITQPEPVVLAETNRLLETLTQRGIAVKEILINQVIIESGACERCRARTRVQRGYLDRLRKEWPALRMILLPAFSQEVRGEEQLRAFADRILVPAEGMEDSRTIPSVSVVRSPRTVERQEGLPLLLPAPNPSLQFVLFCGKGGVGKTTLSSAFALQLSKWFPEKRMLLFSTDPAHSLSDCLGEHVGHDGMPIRDHENLFAIEIDPAVLFSALKQSYAQQIEELFESLRQRVGLEVQFDRKVIADLLDLSPPGLDEIMALTTLADYVEEDRYDLYVLDMAPTGHALRFLELPDLAQDWLRAFFEIVLKYRTVGRFARTSEVLVELSKKIKHIKRVLTDVDRCACMPVAIPTELAMRETRRLISDLRRLNLPLRRLVMNKVATPSDGCGYCDALAQEHTRMCDRYRQTFPELDMVLLPHVSQELKGVGALNGVIQFDG